MKPVMDRKMLSMEEMIRVSNSVEAYEAIITEMFNDKICNPGRLNVLRMYTSAVCSSYPSIAKQIRHSYSKFVDGLERGKGSMCILL